MLEKLVNPSIHKVFTKTETLTASTPKSGPVNPAMAKDKAVCSKIIRRHITDRDNLRRYVKLMKDEEARQLVGKSPKDIAKLDSTKISEYLKENPHQAAVFGIHDPATARKFGDKTVVDFLKQDPNAGAKLGGLATPYRLKANIAKAESVVKQYDAYVGKGKLKVLKESGKFTRPARVTASVKAKAHKLMWWIRDHPVAGGGSAVATIVLIKLALVLLFLDVIEGGHRKKKKQAAQAALGTAPNPMALPGNAPPPAPAYSRGYAAPQYAPPQSQPMTMQQSFASSAPYFEGPPPSSYPTPLQTALNITSPN